MKHYDLMQVRTCLLGALLMLLPFFSVTGQNPGGGQQKLFQICSNSPYGLFEHCMASDIPIVLDENYDGTVEILFHMADVFNEIPESISELPIEYPSFYFRWQQDSQTQITLGPFRDVEYAYTDGDADIYGIRFLFSIDRDPAFCNGQNHVSDVVDIEVLEKVGEDEEGEDILAPYPIQDYTGMGEIFSCYVFADTSPCCNTGCEDATFPMSLCIKCGPQPGPPGLGSRREGDSVNESLYPNPFTDEINLVWNRTKSDRVQVNIVGVNNQETLTVHWTPGTGSVQKIIDTSTLSPGIYIVTINDGDSMRSMKMVKLNRTGIQH